MQIWVYCTSMRLCKIVCMCLCKFIDVCLCKFGHTYDAPASAYSACADANLHIPPQAYANLPAFAYANLPELAYAHLPAFAYANLPPRAYANLPAFALCKSSHTYYAYAYPRAPMQI